MKQAASERFWAKVDKSGECWEWTSAKSNYGVFWVGGPKRSMYAHRWAYEEANGPIPNGMLVCHKCDNPFCVRPGHLFLGTEMDNKTDSVQKRRHAFGVRNGGAKTPERTIQKVKFLLGSMPYAKIAGALNVTTAIVKQTARGVTWRHVPTLQREALA